MEHSFDVDIAQKLGVNCAILLKNLYFWIEKNKVNQRHYHDGYYWTYNSIKAFSELFPYMTERSVRYALNKLEEQGYIKTGNYNQAGYDRTIWYAVTKKGKSILQNCQMELTKLSNQSDKIVKPIPDINQIVNTDINTDIECEADKSAPAPEIEIILNDKSFYPVYQSDIDKWAGLYPAVDIMQELRKMAGWCDANPSRRKTKRGVKQFIVGWLAREQDKGHSKKRSDNAPPPSNIDTGEYL